MRLKYGDVVNLNDYGLYGIYIGSLLDIVNIDRRFSNFWDEVKSLNEVHYCFLTFTSKTGVQKEKIIEILNINEINIVQRELELLKEMVGTIEVKCNIKEDVKLFLLKCKMLAPNIAEALGYIREEKDLKEMKDYYAKEISNRYKLFIETRQGDILKSPYNDALFVYKGIKSLKYKLSVNSMIPTVLNEIYLIDSKGNELVLDIMDFMILEKVGHTDKYKNEMYRTPKNETDKVYRDFSHIKKDFVIYEGIK